MVGAAPDTFLGSAGQTARRAVNDGLVGEPIGIAGFSTSNRVESWHPDPSSHFQPGGGPVPNMGPYYLTAMVNLLGSLKSVSVRAVTSPGRRVESVTVATPTHVCAVLEFRSGVTGDPAVRRTRIGRPAPAWSRDQDHHDHPGRPAGRNRAVILGQSAAPGRACITVCPS